MKEKHWNDEMIELERRPIKPTKEEWVASGLEAWDWRFRAEQAEARAKELEKQIEQAETLMEQARIGLFQIQFNFNSMTQRTTRLLKMCYENLDPHFYLTLDPNPATRRRQMEERTAARRALCDALKFYLDSTKNMDKEGNK